MTLSALYSVEASDRLEALDHLDPGTQGAAFAARDLIRDEDAAVRGAAIDWIRRSRAMSVVASVVDALYDSHPSVRLTACRTLASYKVGAKASDTADATQSGYAAHLAGATLVLRRLAFEEPIWWVRRAAVLAVARIDGTRAIGLLRGVLDDPFWRVRHAAVRALLLLGDEEPLRALIAQPIEGSDRAHGALQYIRARYGLAHDDVREPVAVSESSGFAADPDPAVIAARIERGDRVTLGELVEHLGDPHESLREAASKRLRRAKSPRAILAATLWLAEPRIPHAAESVVRFLDSLGTEVEEVLDVILGDPDARPAASLWAFSFIAESKRFDRLDAIYKALAARSATVRRGAVSALGVSLTVHRESRATDALALALGDTDEDVRRLAMHALVELGDAESWALVSRIPLCETTPLARRLVVEAADRVGDERALRDACTDEDVETRALALHALHARGLLISADLETARNDADPWIRRAVVDAENALTVLADDVDPLLRRGAFEVAARHGDALGAARIAFGDQDPWLRAHAAERLARSTDDGDLLLVLGLSRDADSAVRVAAADASELCPNLQERLVRLRPSTAGSLRHAVDGWLGHVDNDATEHVAVASERENVSLAPRREYPIASPRELGRTGIVVSPLVLSGANEPTIGALFRSLEEGCNAFFWEPRYRSLTTFLRDAMKRGHAGVVIAGTYGASEREIRRDVESALKRLRRERLDVFLVFWTRSDERLQGEAPRALERLKREGLIGAAGFSTHDRALAERAIGQAPWDIAMVRHSAAHPGAQDSLFRRAEENGVGVLGFSATSYGRLVDDAVSASDCYRYTLSQRGVSAVISAPRWSRELLANLDVLRSPTLGAQRISELRAHGLRVRKEALDFARHIRRFPMLPEEALDRELEVASGDASF